MLQDPVAAPAGSPRASDPRARSALPALVHDRPAATLLVDLDRGEVVFANLLAVDLAPDLSLPVSLEEWSRRASLQTPDGTLLEDGPYPLAVVAHGEPARGIQVDAERASDESAAREALWLIGIPLSEAPAPLSHQALIILLPLRQEEAVRALQDSAGDLHARAAFASELSFAISDPRLPDDPLVWVNPAFTRVTGYAAADVLGKNCRFLQGPDTDPAVVDHMRTALREGRTVADTLLNYRKDGTPFWNQVVISPVVDSQGNVTHHVGIQADVTERIQLQQTRDEALAEAREVSERLQLLARVSEELAQHLDYQDAVRALAETVVPALGAWGYVTVTSDRGRHERVHIVPRDPARREDARWMEENGALEWIGSSTVLEQVMQSDSAVAPQARDVDVAASRAKTPPEIWERVDRLGHLGQVLIVPLRARDRVIGALVLLDHAFADQTVETASHVGGRAGLALDNVRLYLRERAAALTLQHSLLPEIPDVPGLDLAASYLPALHRAEVGGDWFDVLPLPDGAIGLAVGDVVGHDLRAAASMGQLRSVLRSYAWSGESASRVMGRLDELVQGLGMADMSTCVYLRLEGSRLTYSRAGHPPPLLRQPNGRVRYLMGALSTPVGVTNLEAMPEEELELPIGATLVIYTDGLVERRDRSLRHGIDALAELLARLPGGLTSTQVRDALVGAMTGPDQEDDICVLVVRRVEVPEDGDAPDDGAR
ncbi:DNA-binding protein [Actinotalea ferrariae CF5-4]|uniref:protein-serine/threonine phosphatase n=1 Tax=Actinotalea ferrariae CF5-4 TaxID=948458 RepID=A0A021VME4_9CELL|nr:SpoIIE family protein phosphatase [Actinotalea ferrariae]EYR62349.1 DNA-binding protein [Actinotalea ferrariae CF5-4]